jgi:hypothetical protein
MLNHNETLGWLMEGDPAIRWQVMRDLLDAPEAKWQAERRRTETEGWGAQLLAKQGADGVWGGPSRWNTLRALRVLKWWNKEDIRWTSLI